MGASRTFHRVLAAAALAAAAAPAVAQPQGAGQSVAQAEQLFEDARKALDAGDVATACPLFDASYKLDPALGTLLNMAACYEQLGRVASAWGRYREVISIATKEGDEQRVTIARERAAALEPRLPRLTIKPPGKPIRGLEVTRDDVPVDPSVLGAGIYVDPGEHAVSAGAPGRRPFSTRVIAVEGKVAVVEIPELEIEPEAELPQALNVIRVQEDLDPGRNRRVLGLGLGGAGIAVLATGLGFGLSARGSWQSAFDDRLCDETTLQCTPAGQERTSSARRNATVANVISGAGAALVVAGAVVYVTAPKRGKLTVAPTAEGTGGAVILGGVW
ncbi:MAG TPA: hypothetical protein VM261_24435 [Kofleriaceae bacterium]|nr:hypothetical protein [Kofleriaceae bacterium]